MFTVNGISHIGKKKECLKPPQQPLSAAYNAFLIPVAMV